MVTVYMRWWYSLNVYGDIEINKFEQGKTQSALAMQAWMYSFGTSQSQFIFINKDGDNAKTNLRRIDDQIRFLPE